MATNPYVNKVEFGNTTVMDITDTTASEADVAAGEVFYKASGARSVGTADYYSPSDTAETTIDDADYFPYYDTSATAKRKSLWSNIKEKLKAFIEPFYESLVKDTVGWTGKNKLPFDIDIIKSENTSGTWNGNNYTNNGVVFTVRDDGRIEANEAAAVNNAIFWYSSSLTFDYDTIINGAPEGSSNNTYFIGGDNIGVATGDKTITAGTSVKVACVIKAGYTADGVVFSPMIRSATINNSTYEPYHKSVSEWNYVRSEASILGAKNLIPYPYETLSTTQRGITFTAKSDGTIDFSGTANASGAAYMTFLYRTVLLKAGTYKVSGGSSQYGGMALYFYDVTDTSQKYSGTYNGLKSDSSSIYIQTTQDGGNYSESNLYGYEKEFTIGSDAILTVQVRSVSNAHTSAVSGTIYPMLRLATDTDSTYQPYAQTNKQLTDSKVSYEDNAITGVHNLLPYPYSQTTRTENNVTFTDNGDGTITVNTGTDGAREYTRFYLKLTSAVFNLPNGTYILSSASTNSKVRVQVSLYNSSTSTGVYYNTKDGDVRFALGSSPTRDRMVVEINIQSGTEVSNLVIKPQIRLASDSYSEYTQYAMTNKELTDKKMSITDLQTVVAASSDFSDFKTRIAAI